PECSERPSPCSEPPRCPPINRTKHPAGAMMLGGLKVGMEEYLKVMKTVVKPWLDSTYPKGNY
ncbi:Uncharacterized protein FKW44_015744, partial [Caligus rogercresseyi]